MKATLVFNPAAGQRTVRAHLRNVVGYLAEHGWVVEWKETTPEVSATELAKEAVAHDAEVVIAAGGDGTINGVVNGLVGHPNVRLGILPTGTANVWAWESGVANISLLGPNLEVAGRVLVEGTTLLMDVGKADDRYFLIMAGAGLDGLVIQRVDLKAKRYWGALAYAWTAVREALKYRGATVRIRVDGVEIVRNAWLVTISNSKLYALVPLAMDASVTDGLLDVGIFAGRSWPQFLRHTINVILRRHMRDPEVEFLRGREIRITSSPQLPVHVDAEPLGSTPMTFTVVPRALHVIVPREMAAQLTSPLQRWNVTGRVRGNTRRSVDKSEIEN
ncbi:MAG: diacylglycerol kinase family lipid kinase [Chloroflexota bacterium]|nr:diacylglycerol kinase family lipid kinase [Chloroflexota bacterium]